MILILLLLTAVAAQRQCGTNEEGAPAVSSSPRTTASVVVGRASSAIGTPSTGALYHSLGLRRTKTCEKPAPNCPVGDLGLGELPRRLREGSSTLTDSDPPRGFAPFYSLHSQARNDHMYSPYLDEVVEAVAAGYVNEGPIGLLLNDTRVLESHCDNLRPLRRFYEQQWAVDHFYTVDERQGERAVKEGYAFEGILGQCVTFAPSCGATIPLHRYWNRAIGDHIFIHKARDFEAMRERPKWVYEGVECFIWPMPDAPL